MVGLYTVHSSDDYCLYCQLLYVSVYDQLM
jgi:hypothetical protein